jgi:hypothetical protein
MGESPLALPQGKSGPTNDLVRHTDQELKGKEADSEQCVVVSFWIQLPWYEVVLWEQILEILEMQDCDCDLSSVGVTLVVDSYLLIVRELCDSEPSYGTSRLSSLSILPLILELGGMTESWIELWKPLEFLENSGLGWGIIFRSDSVFPGKEDAVSGN